ncbi:copper resistance CopC family protein, partial [Streptomyces oceani]|uniref:copper resistance CopC family protein n=1 Tax=Streptomyces oceani TaxID=1075402 RepID=UPI001112D477
MLATVCATLLGTATPAAAHTTLTGSDPAADTVVASAPERVTLDFSGGITLAERRIRVLDPDGDRADTGELLDQSEGERVTYATTLRDDLPDGTYTVVWKGVSSDSHPVSGAFTFSIGAPSETSVEPPAPASDGGVGWLYDLARYAAYAGFVMLFGALAFLLTCWPDAARVRGVRRLTRAGWLGLTVATLVQSLLRRPYVEAGELSDALDLTALGTLAETGTGTALLSRLLLLALVPAALAPLLHTSARTDAGAGTGAGTGTGTGQAAPAGAA